MHYLKKDTKSRKALHQHLSLINSPHSKAQLKYFKEKQGEIGNFQALLWYPGTHRGNSDLSD